MSEWQSFEKSMESGEMLHLNDIPFPPTGTSILDTLVGSSNPSEQRKHLRELMMRWHPDKWIGRNLAGKDREQIMDKVTHTFQRIDKQRQLLEESDKK